MMGYIYKLCQAVFVLMLTTQVNAYAETSYFKESTANQPHSVLKFESEDVGHIFPVSIPKVIPLSINGMHINKMKQRWKIHAFGEFLIPSGDTVVFLSKTDRTGYPALSYGYGYVKFHALSGETYEVTHKVEPEKIIFMVTNSKGELVTSLQVKGTVDIDRGTAAYSKASALYEAASHGDSKKVQVLLNDGAEPDWSTAPNEFTALMVAALRGYPNTVQLLTKAGANVDATNSVGWTALTFAADRGYEAIVALLLDAGTHIDLRYPGEYTALMAAAEHGHIGVVKLLLAKGADTKVKHRNGKTALDFAKEAGNQKVADMLVEKATSDK